MNKKKKFNKDKKVKEVLDYRTALHCNKHRIKE